MLLESRNCSKLICISKKWDPRAERLGRKNIDVLHNGMRIVAFRLLPFASSICRKNPFILCFWEGSFHTFMETALKIFWRRFLKFVSKYRGSNFISMSMYNLKAFRRTPQTVRVTHHGIVMPWRKNIRLWRGLTVLLSHLLNLKIIGIIDFPSQQRYQKSLSAAGNYFICPSDTSTNRLLESHKIELEFTIVQ